MTSGRWYRPKERCVGDLGMHVTEPLLNTAGSGTVMECLWDYVAVTWWTSDVSCKNENPAAGILYDVLPPPSQAV